MIVGKKEAEKKKEQVVELGKVQLPVWRIICGIFRRELAGETARMASYPIPIVAMWLVVTTVA